MNHEIETVNNEQDANKLVAYYISQGFMSVWQMRNGEYAVESWED